MSTVERPDASRTPDVSFVIPCYNEQDLIGYTIPKLADAFAAAGHDLEIVAVENGSTDETGRILDELAEANPRIVVHRVVRNRGYGAGVLEGLPRAAAPWVGIIPADGQVDAEDVVRLYEAVSQSHGNVLGKVRRRFRLDGFRRKVVSVGYNLFVRMLWPRMRSLDINGSPKLMPRDVVAAMDLRSEGWLLDPEIMIKAHYMGVDVLEVNVFSRMRGNGVSHVRPVTVWEFFTYLLHFRFSPKWRRAFRAAADARREKDRAVALSEGGSD